MELCEASPQLAGNPRQFAVITVAIDLLALLRRALTILPDKQTWLDTSR